MKDYGKSIKWPTPPTVLTEWVAELKKAHNRLGLYICCFFLHKF